MGSEESKRHWLVRIVGVRNSIETPDWYDPIRSLHYYGSQSKDDMEDLVEDGGLEPQELETIGYVKIEEEDSGESMVHITPQGEDALSQFRDQQLRYSSINTTQVVSLLVAASAGTVSIIVGVNKGLGFALFVLLFLALIYAFGGYAIEKLSNPSILILMILLKTIINKRYSDRLNLAH